MADLPSQHVCVLTVRAGHANLEIRVNDVPVMEIDGGMRVELPINLWVHNGPNQLTCFLRGENGQPPAPAANFDVQVETRPLTADPSANQRISGISYKAPEGGDGTRTGMESSHQFTSQPPKLQIMPGGVFKMQRAFELQTTFPEWLWLESSPIPESPAVKEDLLAIYRDFWRQLQSGDQALVRQTLTPFAKEFMAAYYLPSPEATFAQVDTLQYMASPDIVLEPFQADDQELQVVGEGHLARLVNDQGMGPIQFTNKERTIAIVCELMYCLKDDQWVQIR